MCEHFKSDIPFKNLLLLIRQESKTFPLCNPIRSNIRERVTTRKNIQRKLNFNRKDRMAEMITKSNGVEINEERINYLILNTNRSQHISRTKKANRNNVISFRD